MVAAAMLIASGCGIGDGAGDATGRDGAPAPVETSEDLTRGELVLRGDKICEEADEEQEARLKAYLKDHPNSQSSPAGRADMVKKAGLPPIRSELEELAAIGAPPGDEEEVTAIIRGIEGALQKGEEEPRSLLGGQDNPFVEAGKLASKYGFKACSNAL